MSKEEHRIAELEAALAQYVQRYGMIQEARRLLVTDPWKPSSHDPKDA